MGKRRFCLSVQRKNYERKRWVFFPVRIPFKSGISVFKVSVPLSSLSSQQRDILTSTLPSTTNSPPVPSSLSTTPLLNSLLNASGNSDYRCIHTCTIYTSFSGPTMSQITEDLPSSLCSLREQLLCSNLLPGKYLNCTCK